MRCNIKKIWLTVVPIASSALVLLSTCTPDIQVYQQSDAPLIDPFTEPYIEYGNTLNAELYGTWYHMGTILLDMGRYIAPGEPSFTTNTANIEVKWRLNLYNDNTWRLALFTYNVIDDTSANLLEANLEAPEQNSIVPSAAMDDDDDKEEEEVEDVSGGYGETEGYTGYNFFAAGPYFEFDGTDKITFTISSSVIRQVIYPLESLTVTIAETVPPAQAAGHETAGEITKPAINKYDFLPTEETAVRYSLPPDISIRLDTTCAGEWERR